MNEERTFDYSALSERISAQMQAYVEVANALVKIIEGAAATRDIVNDTNDLLKEDYRAIIDKLQDIVMSLTVFSSENSHEHNIFDKDIDILKEKIIDFDNKINKLIKDNDSSNLLLGANVNELLNYSKKTVDNISHSSNNVLEEIKKIKIGNDTIVASLNSMQVAVENFKLAWTKIKYVFWAINGILFIFGILKTFNIIDIIYLTKHK